MRFFGTRVVAATATLLALLGLTVGTASADRWVQTVYGEPTTYYVPSSYVSTSYVPTTYVPTSRYVSTGASYYVPTSYSYVLPASYATTAYSTMPTSTSYAAPGYVETSYYRRPGLLRRLGGSTDVNRRAATGAGEDPRSAEREQVSARRKQRG